VTGTAAWIERKRWLDPESLPLSRALPNWLVRVFSPIVCFPAIIIDGTPQPVFSITDPNDNFVARPTWARARTAAPRIVGGQPLEFQKPAPCRRVGSVDAANRLRRQDCDIPQVTMDSR